MSRSWWWPWGAALAASLVLVAAGWLVLFSPLLAVRTVEVVGEDQVGEQTVLDAAAVRLGTPLLRLDVGGIADRVRSLDSVSEVEVTRQWPDLVRIEVVERRPVAVVRTEGGYGALGSDGEVFREVDRLPPDLPLLTQSAGSAERDPSAAAALEVVRELPPRLARRVATVSATSPDEVVLRLRGGAVVAWGGSAGSQRKAEVLLLLLPQHAERYDVSAPGAPVTGGDTTG